jgi:hypothetical protein
VTVGGGLRRTDAVVPAEDLAHEVRDLVERRDATVGHLVVESRPVQHDVLEVKSPLVGGRVDDLRPQVRRRVLQRSGQVRAGLDGLDEVTDEGAVAVQEVVDHLAGPAVPASPDPSLAVEGLQPDRTDERDPLGDRRQVFGPGAEGEVDGVLGHHPVGGELAAGDDGESGRR